MFYIFMYILYYKYSFSGKSAMMFPAPDARKYNKKVGVVYSKGRISVSIHYFNTIQSIKIEIYFEIKCN